MTKELLFTSGEVQRLTNLTYGQVRLWGNKGIVPPTMTTGQGNGTRRYWDFGALVTFRALKALRDSGVSGLKVRKVMQYLHKAYPDRSDYAGFKFLVPQGPDRDVLVLEPGATLPFSTLYKPGQYVLELDFDKVKRQTDLAVRRYLAS